MDTTSVLLLIILLVLLPELLHVFFGITLKVVAVFGTYFVAITTGILTFAGIGYLEDVATRKYGAIGTEIGDDLFVSLVVAFFLYLIIETSTNFWITRRLFKRKTT